MKIRIWILTAFLCSFFLSAYTQNYSTGIGVRLGIPLGVTAKQFLSEKSAIEGIFSTRWSGFGFTGLYEIHTPTREVVNLSWYIGGGAHIGFYDDKSIWFDDPGNNFLLGIDGVLGMEYVFDEFPLVVGIDWIPAFNIVGHQGFTDTQLGISLRYIF